MQSSGLVPGALRLGEGATGHDRGSGVDQYCRTGDSGGREPPPGDRGSDRRSAMELTWVAIVASLAMALATACVFIVAVKRDYFRDIEETKYQVFWEEEEENPHAKP